MNKFFMILSLCLFAGALVAGKNRHVKCLPAPDAGTWVHRKQTTTRNDCKRLGSKNPLLVQDFTVTPKTFVCRSRG
jgi:hypothetical protein